MKAARPHAYGEPPAVEEVRDFGRPEAEQTGRMTAVSEAALRSADQPIDQNWPVS
jgi:hypothetical protein